MPLNPAAAAGPPPDSATAAPASRTIRSSGDASAASVHSRIATSIRTSGWSARISSMRRRNGARTAAGSSSPGSRRRSMSTTQRSGTTFGAVPPSINAALTVGPPISGWVRSGSASSSRGRRRAIDVIAFTPRWGCEPWAAVPCAVAVIQAPPRWATPSWSSVGSPTIAASWSSIPRSQSTFVPWIPASSSSAARWNHSDPPSGTPTRAIAAALASAAAIAPFMSHAPRPISFPSWISPAKGGLVHVSVEPAGTVSRCPFHASEGRSRSPSRATTDGRPSSPRMISGVAPSDVRMSAATEAATSSVPPGFSEGAPISARAYDTSSSTSTDAPAASAAGERTSSTSVTPGTLPAAPAWPSRGGVRWLVSYDGRMVLTDHRSALREGLDADPHPEPDAGERLAAVLAVLIEEPMPSLLFTERAAHLSRHPGEVSFPGGLAEPGDDALVATALRETHEEIVLDPALPDVLGALPSIHTFVSGILVTPFVAAVRVLPVLHESRAEIARVLTVPTRTLAALEEER